MTFNLFEKCDSSQFKNYQKFQKYKLSLNINTRFDIEQGI